jgi:PAS domain S-box-containing protein
MSGNDEANAATRVSAISHERVRQTLPEGGSSRSTAPGMGMLRAPGPDEVLRAVLDLSRVVHVDRHADEVVHTYVDRFQRLFPGRYFCVRLFSDRAGTLGTVFATGRLRPDRREVLEVTYEALERHGIKASHLERVRITDRYVPMFQDGASGFDVPMTDGEHIVGLVAVEYATGTVEPPDDRALIVQLTLQLGSALHNVRLHRESVYLRDYLSQLLDNANAPILVMDRNGLVTFVNRAFLALTHYRREDVLGMDWLAMTPESERRQLLPLSIAALRGDTASNVEVKLPRRDGSQAHVAVNAASILGPDGEVEGVIHIYRDNTELRALEGQIIHAEKLATLGQLAAGVVHELNNPLTSISVYADYLLKKGEREHADAKDVEKLRRIVESAERVRQFTRDLVTYARPSAEKPVLLDIHEVVDQAVVFCEHVIDEVGAVVERRYDRDLPAISGVRGQLVQVLVNLVTNACHAMPMGAGRLTLGTAPRGDGHLILRVTDSGKGIPPDNLGRIFEPFFSTKGEGKGTGLGLSIVKNIVEQHGAEISVHSEVGTGTTFELVFAHRADPPSAPPGTIPPITSAPITTPPSRPPGTIPPVR